MKLSIDKSPLTVTTLVVLDIPAILPSVPTKISLSNFSAIALANLSTTYPTTSNSVLLIKEFDTLTNAPSINDLKTTASKVESVPPIACPSSTYWASVAEASLITL